MDQTPFEKIFGVFADLSRRFQRSHETGHPGSHGQKNIKEYRAKRNKRNKAARRQRAVNRRLDKQSSKRRR